MKTIFHILFRSRGTAATYNPKDGVEKILNLKLILNRLPLTVPEDLGAPNAGNMKTGSG